MGSNVIVKQCIYGGWKKVRNRGNGVTPECGADN